MLFSEIGKAYVYKAFVLFRITYRAGFTDYGDFHLSLIGHFILDFLCYLSAQALRPLVVYLVRTYDDA